MIQLLNKTIKRAVCFLFAAIMVVSTACMFGSCTSANPKVTLTVSFNSKTYKIEYKLYRKFFPQTVQHFIELAESGYYDGLCFHDYQDSVGMFTGGYEYDAAQAGDPETRGLVEREYFSYLEEHNVELTQTVYKPVAAGKVPTEGTNTVVGEFKSNHYEIENNDKKYGSLKDGALVMYYTDKSEADSTQVTVKRNSKTAQVGDDWEKDAEWYSTKGYAKNSATSLFYISSVTENAVNQDYCVFGEPYNEAAQEKYEELMTAITKYIKDVEANGENSFVQETEPMLVDTEDWFYRSYKLEATYKVPMAPIILTSVKVNNK
ncbi:MAG: peptidylprolyl isomerase [Clostridia bacterium]|nr:peptidylprolyl isomerase [Clostridia bacterium]